MSCSIDFYCRIFVRVYTSGTPFFFCTMGLPLELFVSVPLGSYALSLLFVLLPLFSFFCGGEGGVLPRDWDSVYILIRWLNPILTERPVSRYQTPASAAEVKKTATKLSTLYNCTGCVELRAEWG